MSDYLWPRGLQRTRLPCPSLSPWALPQTCLLSQWCHPAISSCLPLLLLLSVFPSIRVFSSESALHIRWPKYWSFSFSISPSREYSGLISFRIDWFDLLTVWKRQFFNAQPSLWSNSHIHTWLLLLSLIYKYGYLKYFFYIYKEPCHQCYNFCF